MSYKYEGIEKEIIESKEEMKEFVYALDDFSEKASKENPGEYRSYVYALCEKVGESLIPFYIGEGKGIRVWVHELDAPKQKKLIEEELEKEDREDRLEEIKKELENELSKKNKKIDEIKARGGTIEKYIIKWGMTQKEAFMAESALINLLRIGGLKFDSSCENDKLTNIVRGHQSEGEKQTGGSTTARTVEEFCEEFAKEPLLFEDLQKKDTVSNKVLLVSINSGYQTCIEYAKGDKQKEAKAIRDVACGNWRMNIDKLNNSEIEYVFATVQARVVGIYKIKEVDGKKGHFMYESANDNSEYPHEETVPFRDDDYNLAELVMEVKKKKRKEPSAVELGDMPEEYQKKFKKAFEKKTKDSKKTPESEFKNSLMRKYMILEDIPEDDPNYYEFKGYMYRRIIHTKDWVKDTKKKKKKERDEAIKAGKKKGLPDPEKVTNNIYAPGNPLRYVK